MLPIHAAAGGIAMVVGFAALFAKKGGNIHRRAGLFFILAMIVMAVSASILEFLKNPNWTNVLVSFMVLYFVGTALTTVRPQAAWSRTIHVAGMAVAAGLALIDVFFGLKAYNSPRGILNGAPFPIFFVLAAVLMLGVIGDLRILRYGALRGASRLRRHLWRMCFSLFIAAGSFFSIRERVAKVLPAPFTTGTMRLLPILLVFTAMFYWMWRVRRRYAE